MSEAKSAAGVPGVVRPEGLEPLAGGEDHHAHGLMDVAVGVFHAVEPGVEEHQHVVVLVNGHRHSCHLPATSALNTGNDGQFAREIASQGSD